MQSFVLLSFIATVVVSAELDGEISLDFNADVNTGLNTDFVNAAAAAQTRLENAEQEILAGIDMDGSAGAQLGADVGAGIGASVQQNYEIGGKFAGDGARFGHQGNFGRLNGMSYYGDVGTGLDTKSAIQTRLDNAEQEFLGGIDMAGSAGAQLGASAHQNYGIGRQGFAGGRFEHQGEFGRFKGKGHHADVGSNLAKEGYLAASGSLDAALEAGVDAMGQISASGRPHYGEQGFDGIGGEFGAQGEFGGENGGQFHYGGGPSQVGGRFGGQIQGGVNVGFNGEGGLQGHVHHRHHYNGNQQVETEAQQEENVTDE